MTYLCPCCGKPTLSRPPVEALRHAKVRPVVKRAIDALLDIYPRTTSYRWLAEAVYARDPTGGPDDAENTLAASISVSRHELASFGWRVGGRGKGKRDQIGLWPLMHDETAGHG